MWIVLFVFRLFGKTWRGERNTGRRNFHKNASKDCDLTEYRRLIPTALIKSNFEGRREKCSAPAQPSTFITIITVYRFFSFSCDNKILNLDWIRSQEFSSSLCDSRLNNQLYHI